MTSYGPPKPRPKPAARIIQKDGEPPVERNVLATAIVEISGALQKLTRSGLTREAVIVLVKDRTGFSKSDIRAVFDSLASLERDFCR